MVRVILDPYSTFRNEGFSAIITEMGIKEFGEDGIPKAYILFDDEGAPITFPIEAKGKSLVEIPESGRSKIKNFGTGAFAEQAKKLGYATFIDTDPDTYEFGTIPSLEGLVTTWEAKKGKDRIDSEGTTKEGYTNFMLVAVSGKTAAPTTPPKTPPVKQGATPPATTQIPAPKPGEVTPEVLTAWKETLGVILFGTSLTNEEIHKATIDLAKALPQGDPKRKIYSDMAKVRVPALKMLTAQSFLTIDADLKFNLA